MLNNYIVIINGLNGTRIENIVFKNIESKEKVKEKLLECFPTLFPDNKVLQKRSKKNTEQITYCTIFELDSYWNNYWLEEIECPICKTKTEKWKYKTLTNFYGGSYLSQCCSVKCSEELTEQLKETQKKEDQDKIYLYNNRDFWYIYKITEKDTNKSYIGMTGREVVWRWWDHFTKSQQEFGCYLRKKGIEHFTFEIIEKLPKENCDKRDMEKKESQYILKYDTIKNGFNTNISNIEVKTQ